ncbi:heat shock protein Hsp20 [Desulfovibrio sp. X2]|uniref:Hsp20/alpha crystallin family protein n=1 Tax=Desulfovibrio sp. X2 TaxID=941449 RepID=UPI000358ECAE|nr:Hsp20/alpha crystallin family protein [Desulfovibrio sp. X2]EPR43104.1 heat shock protein Hsp20 [Desulfovibrio sp. X2]
MGKQNWNPWILVEDPKERMDILQEALPGAGGGHPAAPEGAYVWRPRADVFETVEAVTLLIDLPGLSLPDVVLEVKGRDLWLHGERRLEKDVQEPVYHTLERSYGPFARRFVLPKGLDPAGIRAVLRNGLLTITVPRKPAAQASRQIPISSRD